MKPPQIVIDGVDLDSLRIYGIWKCPVCGRFCKFKSLTLNGLEEVKEITGTCKVHGEVSLRNCDWGFE